MLDVAASEAAWGSFGLLEPGPTDSLIIPDAHLLFSGEYARSGPDLIISDPNHRVSIHNYFLGEKRSPLISADGAQLDARVVEALTGYQTFAQAGGNAAPVKVIGHVATITGSASIVRNGVTIEANNGDVVYQNDVVQTGSGSTIGLVLIDGSTFNLSANARFMLNELGYEGQSSASGTLVSLTSGANHSMFTLVQGAASFVAGQVAKTGDMQIATPSAVIGIRGTAVLLNVDAVDGQVSISVADQQDGQIHSVQVFKCVPTNLLQGVCTAGDPIGIVTSDGPSLTITPTANFEVITQAISKSPGQVAQEFSAFQQVLTTYDIGKQIAPDTPAPSDGKRGDADTKSLQKFAGSPPPSPTEASTTVIADDVKGQAGGGSITPVFVTLASVTGSSASASKPLVPVLDTPQAVVATSFGPVIISSAGGPINQGSQTISGTVDAAFVGSTVTLYDTYNGVTTQIGTVTVRSGGVWSIAVTLAGDGDHSIVALDPNANVTTSGSVVFTLDTAAPTVAITSTGGPVNQASQTITGTVDVADAGASVTILDGTTPIGTAVVQGNGSWSTTVSLNNGSNSLTARVNDAAGNTATSSAVVYTLSTTGPTVTETLTVDTGTSATDHVTANPALSGTGLANTVVHLTIDGVLSTTTATTDAQGAWSFLPSGLADGSHTIVASQTDSFGNTGSAALSFTLDTTAPTVAITSAGGPVNQASQTITGTVDVADAGASVTILDGTTPIGTAVVQGNGSWSTTVSLNNGSNSLTARVSDAAGNTATSSAVVYTLSTTGPTVTETLTVDTGTSATDHVTANPALSGTGLANTVVHLTIDGVLSTTTATTDAQGAWSFLPSGLADGSHTIVASQTDSFGNAGSASLSFTLDTAAPSGGTPDLTAGSDTGTSNTDNLTSATAPTFTVTLTPTAAVGDTVQLLLGGSPLAHPVTRVITATDVTAGSVSLTVTAGDLGADGTRQIAAQFSDAAGNSSTTSALSFTLDTTAPTVAITSTGGPVNQASQTITGTVDVADAGASVTILDGTTPIGTAVVQGNGSWSTTVSLNNGSNSLTARVNDAAGNTATSSAVVYTLSTTGPTVTETLTVDTGTSATDHVTANPALSGTGLANTVVHLTIDGVLSTTTATTDAQGAWSFLPSGLADGSHTIVASQTDSFGNTGSAALSFTLDTAAPTVAITSAGGPVNQASQTITGTVDVADAGASVTILDGTTPIGTAVVQGNGSWSTTVSLNNGSNSLTARVNDAAGNTATSSAVVYTVGVPGAILGDAGDNTLTGTAGNDAFQGFGGNDTINGLSGVDRAVYVDATGGITADLTAGTVTGPGVGTDTLIGIEAIQGSNLADHYSAVGFSGNSGVPGTPIGFNSFEGMGGDDIIVGTVNPSGEILTRISYVNAAAAVIVDFVAGTASGDASVGNDTFTIVNSVIGSAFGDALRGSDNPNGTFEQYDGRAGNDLIDGRGGYDFAIYNNDVTTTTGITVNLAAGTVTGDATIGTDTLRSMEAVRGTNFADTYDATGFSGTSTNAGSSGTFNNFEGMGGNDAIIGNGNTRLQYTQSSAGVTVDLLAGTATGDASVGTDTFTGVNAVMGSMFADVFSGSGANENFMGLAGDDLINGNGGFDTAQYANLTFTTGGISVHLAAGTVIGDASSGTDTLRSIEGIQGTNFVDTYDATNFGVSGAIDPATGLPYANIGNNGNLNQFEGMGGNDIITGNGNTRLIYANATGSVTITFSLNGWTSTTSGASGTVTGDGSVGIDTFSGVGSVSGSSFADTITGSANPSGTAEDFSGRAGNDFIDGKGGFDRAFYNHDGSASGIQVDMASGTVSGDAAIGTDTLRSIEAIRGTAFADTYVATNFGVSGPNVGDFGTFNEFEGMAGDDTITGNGNTRIAFYNALDAVTVDLAAGNSHGTASGDVADVGTDAFTGVNAVRGSGFADVIIGNAGNNTLDGQAGNDFIRGGAGADTLIGGAGADQFVFAAVSESTVASHDTISDFVHGTDVIDISGITGATTVQGLIAGSTQVAAHSIAWIQSGADTIVYVNSSGAAQNQGSADMEVVLTAVTASSLANLDFFHV
ncbi:FecR domain-containing protein [Bradyrhizobium sp. 156]|uniref:Ig-like domain-containing protein n=4 Tax=unclassified Bradyrhizobium TaxID=2631580 RepID=UPI001FFAB016|nr:Ig-like domain-containing protein [Bradyrhizobium sp. 156]MCK1325050.1 FecR domain-containing protein [Bradyrhizobium sp. 156]